jgi:hypothetical protein
VRSFSTNPSPRSSHPNWTGSSNFNNGARWVRPPARFARRHVPLRYLSPIFLGGAYYYAYRYLPYDGPVCSGVTENGCQMQWIEVPVEDGDETGWQCVEFCPQQ